MTSAWEGRARLAWRILFMALLGFGVWAAVGESQTGPVRRAGRLLDEGASVRIQVARQGNQWQEGRVVTSPLGCLRVRLNDSLAAPFSSVPLAAIDALQRVEAQGQWTALAVAPLRSREPAACSAG